MKTCDLSHLEGKPYVGDMDLVVLLTLGRFDDALAHLYADGRFRSNRLNETGDAVRKMAVNDILRLALETSPEEAYRLYGSWLDCGDIEWDTTLAFAATIKLNLDEMDPYI